MDAHGAARIGLAGHAADHNVACIAGLVLPSKQDGDYIGPNALMILILPTLGLVIRRDRCTHERSLPYNWYLLRIG